MTYLSRQPCLTQCGFGRTDEMMRVFLAVGIFGHAAAALNEAAGRLSGLRLPGVRVLPAGNIHLTLRFLGDVNSEQAAAVAEALSQVADRHSGSTLYLGETGAFPNRNRPRVLWIGLTGDVSPLLRLHEEIGQSLSALGFEEEGRRFTPHLTVARIRERTRPADRKRALEAWMETPISPGVPVPIRSVSVMRSILSSEGARYRRLASFDLRLQPDCR